MRDRVIVDDPDQLVDQEGEAACILMPCRRLFLEPPLKLGAALVEVDGDGRAFMRSISATADGAFQDLDARVVAATNRDLLAEMRDGNFREDLFFRLSTTVLQLPPLRQRSGDVTLLVDRFLEQANRKFGDSPGWIAKRLSAAARNRLNRHDWPGNVRELVNVIERSVVLSKSNVISAAELPESMQRMERSSLTFESQLGTGSLKTAMAQPEKQIIIEALEANGWNRQNTAKLLGINRTTLYKKMKKYGIEFERQLTH